MNDFKRALGEAVELPEFTGAFSPASSYRTVKYEEPERGTKKTPDTPTFRHDVFVIHRPWEGCRRCQEAEKVGNLVMGDGETDYVCKHTRRDAYLKACQKMAAQEWTRVSYKEETLKSGVIQVSMSWLEMGTAPTEAAPKGKKKAPVL